MYRMKNNNNEKITVILFAKREKRQRGMISIQSIIFYCFLFFSCTKTLYTDIIIRAQKY